MQFLLSSMQCRSFENLGNRKFSIYNRNIGIFGTSKWRLHEKGAYDTGVKAVLQ